MSKQKQETMNNLLSYCGLVDARISASDNDLPVLYLQNIIIVSTIIRVDTVELLKLHRLRS